MVSVSNTSPLSNLAIIERLHLIEELFGLVSIPPGVSDERDALRDPGAQARLGQARHDRVIQ